MRIVCPSCAAEYEVPESRLLAGKMVRCAKCGSEWVPVRETEADPVSSEAVPPPLEHDPGPPAEATLPSVTAMDRLAAAPPLRRRNRGLIAAWLATGIVLAAAVAAAFSWRTEIVRLWPPGGRILSASGQITPDYEQTVGKTGR